MLSVIIRILVLIIALPYLSWDSRLDQTPLVLESGSLFRFPRNNSTQNTLITYGARWKCDLLYCSEPMITDNKRHLSLFVSLYVRTDTVSNFGRNFELNIQYIGIYHMYADILILHAQRTFSYSWEAQFPTICTCHNHFPVISTNWVLDSQFGPHNGSFHWLDDWQMTDSHPSLKYD